MVHDAHDHAEKVVSGVTFERNVNPQVVLQGADFFGDESVKSGLIRGKFGNFLVNLPNDHHHSCIQIVDVNKSSWYDQRESYHNYNQFVQEMWESNVK